jgi:hypothetical protein
MKPLSVVAGASILVGAGLLASVAISQKAGEIASKYAAQAK